MQKKIVQRIPLQRDEDAVEKSFCFPNLKEALSNPVLNIREKYSLICAAATGDQGVSRTFSRFITLG